jgi:hypothetical protein
MRPYLRKQRPKDAINRRNPYHPPQPTGEPFDITLPHIEKLLHGAFHTHGPLPTPIAFPFSGLKDYNHFQHFLTRLYNGYCAKYEQHAYDEEGADITAEKNPKHVCDPVNNVLDRPPQYRSFEGRYDSLVYELNETGTQLLDDHKLLSPFINRIDQMSHRFMGSCLSASLDIMCRLDGYTFVPRHPILERKGNRMRLPVSQLDANGKRKFLEPDDLFGVHVPGAKRFFAHEVDRYTEPKTSKTSRETLEGKFKAWDEVMENRTYKHYWGIENLRLMWSVTEQGRAETIKAMLQSRWPKLATKTIIKVFPIFGKYGRIPPDVIREVFKLWERGDGKLFDITKGAP